MPRLHRNNQLVHLQANVAETLPRSSLVQYANGQSIT
jgi:hypothetical protein